MSSDLALIAPNDPPIGLWVSQGASVGCRSLMTLERITSIATQAKPYPLTKDGKEKKYAYQV